MPKSRTLYQDDYRRLGRLLADARRAAGLTQRGLAGRLGRAPSLVADVELGQRRLDAFELRDYVLALGGDPFAVFAAAVGDDVSGASESKDPARRPPAW